MGRRSYAGAANHLALAAPFNIGDPTFTTDSPIGWPDGSDGPMQVRINKGQANEQKVLVDTRTGSTFTVSIAGWDGTVAQNHSASEPVELIGSATDLDEANAHVNASLGVHGLAAGVHIAGDTNTQTFTNKSMSGAANTFTNIPRLASPEIDAKLTALDTKDTAQDTALSAEVTRATTAEATNAGAISTLSTALSTETARATAAEGTKVAKAGDTMTGLLVLSADPAVALGAVTKQYADAITTAMTAAVAAVKVPTVATQIKTRTTNLTWSGSPVEPLVTDSVTFDGSTRISLRLVFDSIGGSNDLDRYFIRIIQDASTTDCIASAQFFGGWATDNLLIPGHLYGEFTPTAGAHTFKCRFERNSPGGAGAATINANDGVSGHPMPMTFTMKTVLW